MNQEKTNLKEREARHNAGEAIYRLERVINKIKTNTHNSDDIESLEPILDELRQALLYLKVLKPGF